MNITCSPLNPPKEVLLRTLYLVPGPFFLLAFFLPLEAFSENNWQLFFASTLSMGVSFYWRHLGLKYWEFERLDREFEGLARQPSYAFELRDQINNDLDRMIADLEKWNGEMASRPESLLEANCGHRHKAHGHNVWDN